MNLEHKASKLENDNPEFNRQSVDVSNRQDDLNKERERLESKANKGVLLGDPDGDEINAHDETSSKVSSDRIRIVEDPDSEVRITSSAMRYIQENVPSKSEAEIASELSSILKDCGVKKLEDIEFVLDKQSTLKHVNLPLLFQEPNKKINGYYEKGKVCLNAEYAIRLLTDDGKYNYKGMVKQTIGHEHGHQDKKMSILQAPMDAKFINYLNEVYADFYGIREAFSGSAKHASEVLGQRHEYKKSVEGKDDADAIHPSWEQRKNFVTSGYVGETGELTGNFDSALVNEIASITKCTNDDLIKRACEYFGAIELDHTA